MHDLSYNRDIFLQTTNEIAQNLYFSKIGPKNNVFELYAGLEKVKKGGFALHLDANEGYRILKGTYQIITYHINEIETESRVSHRVRCIFGKIYRAEIFSNENHVKLYGEKGCLLSVLTSPRQKLHMDSRG